MEKGLLCSVYRSPPDCTKGGVTAKAERVVLIGAEGPFSPCEKYAPVYLSEYCGRKIATPEPLKPGGALTGASGKWWMFGGNYIATCDSRFPNPYPIPVYDRTE